MYHPTEISSGDTFPALLPPRAARGVARLVYIVRKQTSMGPKSQMYWSSNRAPPQQGRQDARCKRLGLGAEILLPALLPPRAARGVALLVYLYASRVYEIFSSVISVGNDIVGQIPFRHEKLRIVHTYY